jgi:hypothetical protein
VSEAQAKQERTGAAFMSLASIFIAVMEWVGRPEPDWYVTFNAALHGAILVLLIVALVRLPRMVADRPTLKTPFLAMILVGIVAAAYVLGRDFGLV